MSPRSALGRIRPHLRHQPLPGKSGEPVSQGAYWWGGAAGTAFSIDPKENLFGVFLINVLPPDATAKDQFKRLTYLALQ